MLIGLVGKPSVGKSSFFKSASLAEVDIANYPFTTIKPNRGAGHVKIRQGSLEFNKTDNPREGYTKGEFRFVPVELMDVAGLVPGASTGEGMGNQFLDDLRQADILIHVIDASGSTNAKGEPVDSLRYDPAEDIRFLEIELDIWYEQILKKGWDKFSKTVQQTHGKIQDALAKQLSGMGVTEDIVSDAIHALNLPEEKVTAWTDEDLKKLATKLREATKPMVIAANKADVKGAMANVERLQKEFPQYKIVPCTADFELALREADKHKLINYIPGEKDFEIISEDKLTPQQVAALNHIKATIAILPFGTGVQEVLNAAVFGELGCVAIFPGGSKLEDSEGRTLPDCFILPKGSTALDFAYRLHTDFGKNFVRAIAIRTGMNIKKDHVLENRDIVEILASK